MRDPLDYSVLTPDHAAAWRALRLEGARAFPLGFLVTAEEAERLTVARCAEILGFGGLRGVHGGDGLLGFCGYRPQRLDRTRHRAEIGPFYVTPTAQGTGAADTLIAGVIAEARQDGVSRLELYVDAENSRAIAFYARHGFTHMATLHDHTRIDGVPRDDHVMVRSL